MKKFMFACACVLMATGSMLAVPPGSYYDSSGNFKALVSDQGNVIYLLNRDGTVRRELEVTHENADGSFATKDTRTGITHSENQNAWFESDGKICLNVKWLRETVTRE